LLVIGLEIVDSSTGCVSVVSTIVAAKNRTAHGDPEQQGIHFKPTHLDPSLDLFSDFFPKFSGAVFLTMGRMIPHEVGFYNEPDGYGETIASPASHL